MSDVSRLLVVAFCVAFLFGLRSTVRLWARTRDRSGDRLVLVAGFASVATLVTTVAGVFGVLGVRAMAGLPRFDWAPALTIILVGAVVLIPVFLDYVVTRVEEGR